MTTDTDTVRGDLAFLKSLVSEGGRAQISGGLVFMAGGVLYGVQCFLQWLEYADLVSLGRVTNLVIGIAPTILFLIVLGVVLWRDRHVPQTGVATRALNAAFGAAGLANLFMNLVFGYVAITRGQWLIWMLYPPVLCALQGGAWYVAYMIRRKAWIAVMSGGWFLSSLLLAWRIETPEYLLILSGILFGLMAAPGYMMLRHGKAQG